MVTTEPVGARVCIRAARFVVWPIGVYSTWASSVRIERITTSPVFTPTPDLDRRVACFPQAGRVSAQALLHEQRGVKCALGMILLRVGRAKQGEDTIAGRLYDVAIVVMNRIDHQLERRIDDPARFFRVEVFLQRGRTLDVGE